MWGWLEIDSVQFISASRPSTEYFIRNAGTGSKIGSRRIFLIIFPNMYKLKKADEIDCLPVTQLKTARQAQLLLAESNSQRINKTVLRPNETSKRRARRNAGYCHQLFQRFPYIQMLISQVAGPVAGRLCNCKAFQRNRNSSFCSGCTGRL